MEQKSLSLNQKAWKRLKRNKAAMFGLYFILLSFFVSFVLFYMFHFILHHSQFALALGFSSPKLQAGVLAAMFLYEPLSLILGIFSGALSRKFEFQADAYAANTTKHPKELSRALQKLSVDNLSNLNPHPWKVWLEYSHPPVTQRIARLH